MTCPEAFSASCWSGGATSRNPCPCANHPFAPLLLWPPIAPTPKTPPRSPQGKARVALNALQHGRYAVRLRENLVRAGEGGGESQYQWFRSEIAATFGASGHEGELQAEQMAARA